MQKLYNQRITGRDKMSRSESVILTNMCMVKNGEYVLVQDRKDPNWSGIVFPGGHVEKDEDFSESVIREIFEETGLTIERPHLCGIKNWRTDEGERYVVLLYKTENFAGDLKSSREGEVFWVKCEELAGMKLASSFEHMLKVFLNDDINELYSYKENDEWKYRFE